MAIKSVTRTEDDIKFERAEKILGQPKFIEFTEDTLRIRRNLLLTASISLFFVLGGGEFDGSITLIGVKISAFSQNAFYASLTLILAYHIAHFTWQTWDTFLEWRFRLSGTFDFRQRSGGFNDDKIRDFPPNPRNSSLFGWWLDQAHSTNHISDILSQHVPAQKQDQQDSPSKANHPASTLQSNNIDQLNITLHQLKELQNSERIKVSLFRFETHFLLFQRSQIWRFLGLEFGFPFVLSFVAIGGLLARIYAN